MSEQKSMNSVIHAAFRRDLARFDDALARFDGSADRAKDLGRAWDNLAAQLRNHHLDEERHFQPALVKLGADPMLVGTLDGEHQGMLQALDAADAAMQVFRSDATAASATSARAAVANLRAVLIEHLTHEERDLEPLAAAHRKSPEMKQAVQTMRKDHRGEAGTFFAWLVDGLDPQARALLRREVPGPVVFVLSRIAGRDYNRQIAPVWR